MVSHHPGTLLCAAPLDPSKEKGKLHVDSEAVLNPFITIVFLEMFTLGSGGWEKDIVRLGVKRLTH